MRSTYSAVKRGLDVAGSAAGLAVLSPLLLGLAVAVRFSSPGSILFRQERMGRFGVPFQLLKFRSMEEGGRGPQVTAANDPRITGIGRVLRRYKLDELPQLVNVLRGDMSLVGPRPEVRRYVERFPDDYATILTVRPGITDEAAIAYRDEEGLLAAADDPERAYLNGVLPAKIRLYHSYVENASLRTDLSLLARTILALVRRT